MRKNHSIYFTIILALIVNSCSASLQNEQIGFIKVNNNHFELGGKPYYFLGANFWYAVYLGASGDIGDRERLLEELDFLKSMGIINLRIMGASEESYIPGALTPGFLNKPGEYNEDLLEGLDFLLSEMGRRNMHAVIFLTNTWEWSGGMSQYNAWINDSSKINPRLPNIFYGDFMNYTASFYRNEEAKRIYYEYIYRLINRKNIFTKVYYYEDPTIMAWQIANEPRPGHGDEAKKWFDEYYRWINSTALYIHKLDPNHLVSSGSEGTKGSLDSAEVYLTAHKSRYIDYLTFHLWPKEWGWYDPKYSDSTYHVSEVKAIDYINEHIKMACELKKPIVMEEFGLPRDYGNSLPGSATNVRNKYFSKILSLLYDSAVAHSPAAGANFWVWGGNNRNKMSYCWGFGTPSGGGVDYINSIFDQDTITVKIMKNFIRKFSEINRL